MIESRWELKLGSPVLATDGKVGRLKQAILDPHQERIIALLVQQHGPGTAHTVVVPESAIADASDGAIQLKISREQVAVMPEHKPDVPLVVEGHKYEVNENSYAVRGRRGMEVGRAPSAQLPGVLEDQLARPERAGLALQLQAGSQVFCTDGHAGKVSQILLNPKGRVNGFVMHAGHLPGRDLIVPAAYVRDVDLHKVHLSVEKSALEKMANYSPDFFLTTEVDDALWADDILRVTDYNEIQVLIESGIVTLKGHVVTHMNRLRAENATRSVAGVLGIQNHLVVDDDLELEVARALANDEHTRQEKILVGAQNGVVTLNGQVSSATTRETAEEVAASVPQVRGVVNYLNAPNVVVNPDEQRVMEPPIGGEVYATDTLLGHAERVIINHHNRRVIAFVALADFTELLHSDEDGSLEERPHEERRVIVPICDARYETNNSVLLGINSGIAIQYCDFNPVDFISPPEDWQPPHPYQRENILFERKSE